MLVEFGQTLFVTEVYTLGQYGEVMLSSGGPLENPTNVVAQGAAAQALQAANDLNNIQLDDGVSWSNYDPTPYLGMGGTLRGGDSTDNLTGVLGYSFGAYEIQPVGPVTFDRVNDRPAGPPSVGGELTVASFNVLNYFSTIDTGAPICGPASDQGCRGADSVEEFGRQNTKIVNAIVKLDADVVGLMEIENHASDAAVIDLVDGLNAVAGAGTYDYIATGAVGSDVIKVAAIYKPASVTPVGPFAILDSSVDPTFNDDKSRPVVAQTFAENSTGELFTIAVNHFKSKGSDCDDLGDPDTGDGQGNCNVTRTLAATALVNWLAGDPTGSGDGDALIIGDLNSYAKEDPISAITGVGYTDLIETYRGVGRAQDAYSYVFSGQWGYLDHALANESMATQVTGAGFWHINADEPPALDYQAWNNPSNQTSDEFRSSDHDPVVIGVTLDGAMAEIKRAAALLADTHPSGDNRTDHFLGKAFDAIDQSLNDGYWDGDDTISSKKVFDDIAKAIREIGHASRYGVLDDATAQAAIDKLVGAARVVAAAALDAAAADPSDPVHLSRGADWLQQGDDAASEGEDAIAVLKYKQAWVEAGRAVS
jgi:predicted extracellular nuclease